MHIEIRKMIEKEKENDPLYISWLLEKYNELSNEKKEKLIIQNNDDLLWYWVKNNELVDPQPDFKIKNMAIQHNDN